MRMPRISICLKPQQAKPLKKLSAKTGAPIAVLIRRAIDMYLKRVKK